jgi:hypothetical protein
MKRLLQLGQSRPSADARPSTVVTSRSSDLGDRHKTRTDLLAVEQYTYTRRNRRRRSRSWCRSNRGRRAEHARAGVAGAASVTADLSVEIERNGHVYSVSSAICAADKRQRGIAAVFGRAANIADGRERRQM